MRIPGSKVWRAFRELDRFSDVQCERFVRAARPPLVRWAVAIGACVVLPLVLWIGGWMLAVWITDVRWLGNRSDNTPLGLVVGLLAVTAGTSFMCGLFVRDWLLIRAVRRLINRRGCCASCGYLLLGLPVPESLCVICPECGNETNVDESLGELATDAQGRASFAPKQRMERKPWLTKRQWKWVGIGLTSALAITAGVYFGGQWWSNLQLQRQAIRAAAMRTGIGPFMALYEANQPVKGGDDAWGHFDQWDVALRSAEAAESQAPDAPKDVDGSAVMPEYWAAWSPPRPNADNFEIARHNAAGESARRMLARLERDGAFAHLDAVAASPRALRAMLPGPDNTLVTLPMAEAGPVRNALRILAAHGHIALERGDTATAALDLKRMTGVCVLLERQPLLISRLVANGCEASMWSYARELLAHEKSAELVSAVAEALRIRTAQRVGLESTIEGERLYGLDAVCAVFADVERVRSGKLVDTSYMAEKQQGRVGSLEENLAYVNAMFDAYRAALRAAPGTAARSEALPTSDLEMAQGSMLPMLSGPVRIFDLQLLDYEGMRVQVEVEQFRLKHGRYPDSLDELTPSAWVSVPIDPFSGRPISFKRVDPAADPQGRAYLIYVWGLDGKDNSGRMPDLTYGHQGVLWDAKLSGFDYVLNDKDR